MMLCCCVLVGTLTHAASVKLPVTLRFAASGTLTYPTPPALSESLLHDPGVFVGAGVLVNTVVAVLVGGDVGVEVGDSTGVLVCAAVGVPAGFGAQTCHGTLVD